MASKTASRYLTAIFRTPPTISPSILRPYPRLPRTLQPITYRFAHTIPKPTIPAPDDALTSADITKPRKQLEPHYQLTFTCVPCTNRSTHVVSKQGYHKGSVLITCPSCRNRHVISDNLNIFGDCKITVEELLREKGQLVKRGTLGEEGDIEFWEDNSTAPSEVAEASTTSTGGEGEQDEARRLRETRDPSSRATDPMPSASVLPGDTGTRPSVQGVSHQGRTPSTRRQYHKGTFKPPFGLSDKNKKPVDRTKLTSTEPVSNSPFEEDGVRLISSRNKTPMSIQLKPGIPVSFRPPGGVWKDEDGKDEGGKDEGGKREGGKGEGGKEKDEDGEKKPTHYRNSSGGFSQQFGYYRPSFLPPVPAEKWAGEDGKDEGGEEKPTPNHGSSGSLSQQYGYIRPSFLPPVPEGEWNK